MSIFKKAVYAALFLFLSLAPVNARMAVIESPGIVINLPSRTLELYSGTTLVKEYPIAIGKPSTQTPLGSYSITNMEVNPVWIPPGRGYVVESGPDNPLGYRWMGFLPLYGIHGTNAAWTIGLAVSNGCVRMNEADAEELFEIIGCGTPVQVTYERIKIRVNGKGEVSLAVYPDIYGYQQITVADVYNKLAQFGLNGWISENFVQQLIEQGSDKQVTFAQYFSLKINDQQKNERGVLTNNTLYVPVWPVASGLKTNILWDEQDHLVRGPKCAVPGLVKGDIVYVTMDNLQKLFGCQEIWKPAENILEVVLN
ncbi:MAG: L,D-transpeptidase [Veillonellales bacterium]